MVKNTSTEEQILRAAFDIFIEKGLADSRMQDIADRAGTNRTVVNYYFRTKDKLIKRVVGDILRRGMPDMVKMINGDLPLFEKIEKFTEQYLETIADKPFMPLFLINELGRNEASFLLEVASDFQPNIDGFSQQVKAEITAGNIIDIHPLQLYMNIISLCAFPIIGKGLFTSFTSTDKKEIEVLLEDRKRFIAPMIIKSIKKQ